MDATWSVSTRSSIFTLVGLSDTGRITNQSPHHENYYEQESTDESAFLQGGLGSKWEKILGAGFNRVVGNYHLHGETEKVDGVPRKPRVKGRGQNEAG